jgi:hypothetical protein
MPFPTFRSKFLRSKEFSEFWSWRVDGDTRWNTTGNDGSGRRLLA